MKNTIVGIIFFLVSYPLAYLMIGIPASQIPFHGEAFVGVYATNGLIYLFMYLIACAYSSVRYAKTRKAKYVVRLACFLVVTALAGYAINRYRFYTFLVYGIWQ